MDKDSTRHHNHSHNNNNIIRDRERIGEDGSVLLRASSDNTLRSQTTTSASDFVLQWGNRKRLRCMKVQTAHDSKKGGGGSSSGSGELAAAALWPPKFVIALTNKEKEEDFFAFKGSKLPQRPKKRSKFIQRTLNLVSPGAWLCDLTLERYEVREKKIIKKRPRGLKAMGNMESESE
uniref:Uncharacterized protein n=1 Tax=Cannabis sativa TaxID=3483 RepID=A0A803NP29_CANSA